MAAGIALRYLARALGDGVGAVRFLPHREKHGATKPGRGSTDVPLTAGYDKFEGTLAPLRAASFCFPAQKKAHELRFTRGT